MPKFTWNIDPVIFDLGPLEIRYYSLIFVLVFAGGYWLLRWQIERGGGKREDAEDFIVYGVLGVLLGARFGHVLFYDLDKAIADPVWVFKIWEGGLASHGATLGLILAMFIFTWRRGIPFLEGADRFAFSAALGATLVRLGNFMNSEIVGRKTDGSWGVWFKRFDPGEVPVYRYPSQLFEAAIGVAVLLLLLLADQLMGKERRPRGALAALFFLMYFTGRFFIEYVKEYQNGEQFPELSRGQILSLPGIALGVGLLVWSFRRRLPAGWVRHRPRPEDMADAPASTDPSPEGDGSPDEDVEDEFDKDGALKRRPPGS